MRDFINTNILVIDDEEMVRDNIEEILMPRKKTAETDSIDQAASILFDSPNPLLKPHNKRIPDFHVKKASNGVKGLEMVKKSIEEKNPFAVIFVDMRMPGWDGLETAIQIRKYDSKAEIVFVTAFSDHSIEEIVERAGQNVGYHCKPYASEEILQLATKAVTDYSKLRNLERLIEAISSISLNERQLSPLLRNILDQLASYVRTDVALLGKLHEDYRYEKIFSIGAIEEKINLDELIGRIKSTELPKEEVVQIEEIMLAQMDDYIIFAALQKNEKLKTEKLYLLRLFLQHAAKAIKNAELQEKLIQKEKLSAAGSAISMIMHDLRSPIHNISILTKLLRDEGVKSEYLNMIDECNLQATEIFDDFLDFVKETKISKKPVDLHFIVKNAVINTKTYTDTGLITIRENIPEKMVIGGDESKLKRCVGNLLINAVDVLTASDIRDPAIDISAEIDEEGKSVLLFIKDNGIPWNMLETIFEPFVTKSKSNGTGLGLAIVRQYISAHGGDIKAYNDDGAVFHIKLPIN